MTRLVFLEEGRRTLQELQRFIANTSGYADVARAFRQRLLRKCREIAEAPFPLGRERPELRPDLRSLAVGNYVIFFRQSSELVEIVAVVEGHRDLGAFIGTLPAP